MPRSASRLSFLLLSLSLSLSLALVLSACQQPIRVSAAPDAARLRAYSSFALAMAPLPGDAEAPDPGVEAALLEALRAGLIARGYVPGGEAAGLLLRLAPGVVAERRRTWSSDPDASAIVEQEVVEAVVSLEAVDRERDVVVWRADARSRLSSLGPARSRTAIFGAALERLVARIPAR